MKFSQKSKSSFLDIKKRIFQRILANFISVITIEEWRILAHNNINVYNFFKKESPEVFNKFVGDGKQQGISKKDVQKYCNQESIEELLQNHLPDYLADLKSNGSVNWLHNQLEYILTNVV